MKFLSQWFQKGKKDAYNEGNHIIFSLNNHNEPFVNIKIQNTDNISAEAYGNLIYSITNGLYNKSILDTLVSVGSADDTIYRFVEQSLAHWIKINKQSNNYAPTDEPVIKPTSFNKISK